MAIVFPDFARKDLLDFIVKNSDNCYVTLFKNDVTPDQTTVFEDLDDADFSGFAFFPFYDSDAAVIDGDGRGRIANATVTFTRGVGATTNTIYGWALIWIHGPGIIHPVLFVERFPAPILMASPGDEISFSLTVLDELGT